jgi:urea transport system permease protein
MIRLLLAGLCALLLGFAAPVAAQDDGLQALLKRHGDVIAKGSRKTVGPAIDALAAHPSPHVADVLRLWQSKSLWRREADGAFFRAEKEQGKSYRLYHLETGADQGVFAKSDLKQIKPNSGVRALLGSALVRFQLTATDPAAVAMALKAIERAPQPAVLEPLRAALGIESTPALQARKHRLERLLTMAYGASDGARVQAIQDMSGDLGVDVRAALNPLLAHELRVFEGAVPKDLNIAAQLEVGKDLSHQAAYDLLVQRDLAAPVITSDHIRDALTLHIDKAHVAGIPVHQLDQPAMRIAAYDRLAQAGQVSTRLSDKLRDQTLARYRFVQIYSEPSRAVTSAARVALQDIETRVAFGQALDLGLDALSLASIYFLAAIGLAITFGVMGVINMAHGEFIMMGAYTGFVVQQVIPNHTLSILVALPLAFAVTFAAGVAMERLVIRHLYNRPLETLLATFGISIALQQLAKNVFGTQARPLTAPAWLDGAWVMNDVVAISYIRIAIFVLALIFLARFLFIMKRTRLGLETRAVTQNRAMAASMGINPDRVNMLTFGLGSGIAGIAGVAIGLFAKVTSELGSDYIVQSFMTVVVGGVGNIWGTLAGAAMIGTLQKGIEWFNPSNTLAAQTYMIIFIILFIQFRPRGIVALKGRAAGD